MAGYSADAPHKSPTRKAERDAQRDEWPTAASQAMSQVTESRRSQASTAQYGVETAETARPE